jgi:hypothetical protein
MVCCKWGQRPGLANFPLGHDLERGEETMIRPRCKPFHQRQPRGPLGNRMGLTQDFTVVLELCCKLQTKPRYVTLRDTAHL